MQPLGSKKKSRNLSGPKKSPLGLKKITKPIGPEKNHATSWAKKITQPLRQKNKSRNLLDQIKITQPLGQKQ